MLGKLRLLLPASKRTALRNIWRHTRAFGILRGPRIWHQLRARHPNHAVVCVRVPGVSTPIMLRTGTSDAAMFRQIFLYEEYRLPFEIHPDLIIDGGANIGLATVYFKTVYPAARILAVEPEASNVEVMRSNTASYENVTVLQAALWHRGGTLTLENPEGSTSTFQVQERTPGQLLAPGALQVEAVTVTDLLGEAAEDDVVLLKLDVEGAEKEIFMDNTSWLERIAVIMIELHDRFKPGCSEALYAAIAPYGFKEYRRGEHVFLLRA